MLDQGYATGDGKIEPNPLHFPRKITILCRVDCASRLAYLKSVKQSGTSDPGERLISFQAAVKAEGWRGSGLESHERPGVRCGGAQWSKAAGITYWKIDGPDMNCACSNAAKKVFPELIIEHGSCPVAGCPLNDPSGGKVYGIGGGGGDTNSRLLRCPAQLRHGADFSTPTLSRSAPSSTWRTRRAAGHEPRNAERRCGVHRHGLARLHARRHALAARGPAPQVQRQRNERRCKITMLFRFVALPSR